MIRLRRAACALVVATMCPLALVDAPTFAASATTPDTSTIQFTEVAPAAIPAQGTVVLQGTLYNGSGEAWHHLKVVPATTYRPLTSAADIADAASADPNEVTLGSSLWSDEASLPDLAAGATTTFTISIPRADLRILGTAGVYTVGARPVSDESHPKSLTARTFLPLLPTINSAARVNVSLLLPLRGNPLRTATGELADPSGFTSLVSADGRLGRINAFAQQAGDRPLTWLVDPAFLDLASDQVAGTTAYPIGMFNSAATTPAPLPSESLGVGGSTTGSGSPSNASTASGSPSDTASGGAGAPQPLSPDQIARLAVRDWLNTTTTLLKRSAVFALPYADPSVESLVGSGHSDILTSAITQSTQAMSNRGLIATSAVAPVSGTLSQASWSVLPDQETAFVNASATTNTTSTTQGSHTLVITSGASGGGPGPGNQTSALQVRQRILAEASLVTSTPTTTNLVVELPANWDPGEATSINGFFGPLTQAWINFTGSPSANPGTVNLTQAAPQLSAGQRSGVEAMLGLQTSISRLMSIIAPAPVVAARLTRQLDATAWGTVSADGETTPAMYRGNAAATGSALGNLLDHIVIQGSEFVTLSGSSGIITVAVENDLNVPVRVGLQQTGPKTRSPVTVAPVAPLALDPGERSTVRIHLNAPRVSVQEVTLTPTTATGVAVGSPFTFTVRSSSVGTVVWAITIALVVLILGLLFRRIGRRLRAKRGAADPPAGDR